MAAPEGASETLRQAIAHAEDLIGATLELVARAGAARWCAYLVPHENESWRVALATGAGAPAIDSVWSAAEVEQFRDNLEGAGDDSSPAMIRRHVHLPGAGPSREEVSFEGGDSGDSPMEAPAGLLWAAPNADQPESDHGVVAETLHALFDHLTALVTHHAEHASRTPAASENGWAATATSVDPVTGLLTRDAVLARLGDEVARAKRYGGALSVLACDLDQLGDLAQVVGPGGRAAVLLAVAGALRGRLRQMDCAGRYGDHSLLVVLPETGADEALRAANRLAQYVAEAVAGVDLAPYLPALSAQTADVDTAYVPVVPAVLLRIGASTFPTPAKSVEELLGQANDALRAVRASGGEAWLGHALDGLNEPPAGGFPCVCRRCGKVFHVMDRAQQRARRFCSHECYTAARREGGQERDDLIRELRGQGQSLRTIGRQFGISAERVRQILDGAVAV